MLFTYRMVKLNMFFGSLLCTADHIELSEIVEYLMTLGKTILSLSSCCFRIVLNTSLVFL